MDIKVDINAEQINQAVCKAIAESAIGVELEKEIKKQVDIMSKGYNNPFASIIQSHINKAAQEIIQEKYSDTINELVKKNVTEQFTEDLFTKLWQSFSNKY